MYECMYVGAWVRAWVRGCVCECVSLCVCVCARARVSLCVAPSDVPEKDAFRTRRVRSYELK